MDAKSNDVESVVLADTPEDASTINKNKKPLPRWVIGSLLAMVVIIASIVCIFLLNKNNKTSLLTSDKEIIDAVVDNFMPLTKVPRPSHHEEQISNWLRDWAVEQGFETKQDEVYNVMFDVPATKGMENKPLGILQGHMDMVVAVADDKEFDPLNDTITVIRNDTENTLTADGTSLGGDDGAGVAMIMSVAQGKMAHGPLRMIITVDEEDGMTGALNVDSSWFENAAFLINIDNEWSNQVLVSTAAGDSININQEVAFNGAAKNSALNIEISNLKGGHSGVEIDKGRLNGIIGLATFLKDIREEGINYELASFEGGTASNAIPAKAGAVIVLDSTDRVGVEQSFAKYCENLNTKYVDIEDEIKCEIKAIDAIPQVISQNERDNLIKYITEVIDGVYTMSEDMEGLVESSSNLGIVKLNSDGLKIAALIRSSSPEKEVEIVNKELELAKTCGYTVTSAKSTDAWPFDPDSELLALAKKVYKERNGEEIEVAAVHAGLECGTFKKIKPELDMVSIGPDLKNGHTINETLYLNSIPRVWRLLEGILAEYKN